MRYSLTAYYSVSNGGDGSAYPQFFKTEEQAESHQDNLHEGWGESCTGSITFHSDSPITTNDLDDLCFEHNESINDKYDWSAECSECKLEKDMEAESLKEQEGAIEAFIEREEIK